MHALVWGNAGFSGGCTAKAVSVVDDGEDPIDPMSCPGGAGRDHHSSGAIDEAALATPPPQ